jgi:Tfp pilus assembly protein PilX
MIKEGKMERAHIGFGKRGRKKPERNQRGVALVTTLLLLLLLTGLSLTMVFSARSDMLINGYYRNFRGSFYAADSGLNIARAAMLEQLKTSIPATFSPTTPPIPPGTDATVLTFLKNTYGQNFQSISTGPAANSWPSKFKIDPNNTTFTQLSCMVNNESSPCSPLPAVVNDYTYRYNYTVTALGQTNALENATISDRGQIKLVATLVSASSKTSFAAWGMFIDQWPACTGTLVPGTISGPAFTNGAWTFGSTGTYDFTDEVGSASPDAGFQFNSGCETATTPSDTRGKVTIAPLFEGGFNMGQPAVPLPANDFNQERAVLDGKGSDNNPVGKSDLHNALRDINGNPYPSSGAASGVFLPYQIVNGKPTFTGGGIYVEGNAAVTLSTSGSNGQVYTIVQGSTTTVVTVDPSTNTTVIQSGGNTQTIAGVPQQIDPVTNVPIGPATMLYADGNITSLSGPGQGVPAIQDHSDVTVTASGNVTITGDVLYKSEPVTLTQNQIPGMPADTMIPGNDTGQALGIYTAKGDIQLNNLQANSNLEIDASLATISQGGTGGLVNVGSSINTLTIVGGRIQNSIKNINSKTRNVFFDRRFAKGGFAPPWFPSTSVTLGSVKSAQVTTTVQRLQWVNQTSYF